MAAPPQPQPGPPAAPAPPPLSAAPGPGQGAGPGPPLPAQVAAAQAQDFDPVQRFRLLIPQLKESLQVNGACGWAGHTGRGLSVGGADEAWSVGGRGLRLGGVYQWAGPTGGRGLQVGGGASPRELRLRPWGGRGGRSAGLAMGAVTRRDLPSQTLMKVAAQNLVQNSNIDNGQ